LWWWLDDANTGTAIRTIPTRSSGKSFFMAGIIAALSVHSTVLP